MLIMDRDGNVVQGADPNSNSKSSDNHWNRTSTASTHTFPLPFLFRIPFPFSLPLLPSPSPFPFSLLLLNSPLSSVSYLPAPRRTCDPDHGTDLTPIMGLTSHPMVSWDSPHTPCSHPTCVEWRSRVPFIGDYDRPPTPPVHLC